MMMFLYRMGFLISFFIPCLTVVGFYLGGAWNFLTLAVVFGVVPVLDPILGKRLANFTAAVDKHLKDDLYFRFITWLYVPFQLCLLVWACLAARNLAPLEWVGLVLSMGTVTGGLGITIAHELGHRSGKFEQNLSKALLMSVCYTHFFIEHNQGHHSQVATPHDPASARFGESLYRFYFRTVIRSYQHAWVLERNRLKRKNLGFWSIHNRMIRYSLAPFAITAGLAAVAGPVTACFFVVQSVVAFSLLEMVNYVEHYGLSRRETESGRFEKVTQLHSWNASEMLTNFLIFNLQRHSDHHANATRRYQNLRHFPESPQLPTGYAGMILMALVPPLWRRVMDPRAELARRQIALA